MSYTITKEIDFDCDDVIDYIEGSNVKDSELQKIITAAAKSLNEQQGFQVQTLDDELKLKVMQQAYKKYSLTQLENLLKY